MNLCQNYIRRKEEKFVHPVQPYWNIQLRNLDLKVSKRKFLFSMSNMCYPVDETMKENMVLRLTQCQTTVEWEIKDYFDLPKEQEYYLASPTFIFAGVKWYLRIYPNGSKNRVDWTGIFLCKKRTKKQYNVDFTISILNVDFVCKNFSISHIYKEHEEIWGLPSIIKISELLNLKGTVASEGVLTVICKINLKEGCVLESDSRKSSLDCVETLSRNFKELFLTGEEGDVTFKVNEARFVAHKLVLGARSTVFQTMFKTDMLEKNSGIVEIEDSDPSSFKDFLTYIYSGKLEATSSANALGVYSLAEKYDFQELKVVCCECMAREMSADSVCDVVHLASMHDEQELLEMATQYFVKHANAVLATPKWISFMKEHTILANELLLKMANK